MGFHFVESEFPKTENRIHQLLGVILDCPFGWKAPVPAQMAEISGFFRKAGSTVQVMHSRARVPKDMRASVRLSRGPFWPAPVVRSVKRTALSAMKTAGVFVRSGRSRWRQDRLLILGYHGIAQHDEHQWAPALFITAELFESRLRFLKSGGFNILPLHTALCHLRAGTLPERSVAITFDDGYVDFYRMAHPILKAYQVPATVYLTTYYSERNLPIPGITAAYMAWMTSGFVGKLKTIPAFGHIDLRQTDQRRRVSTLVGEYFTDERTMAPARKHELLESLADELGFDLRTLRERRLMHLMSPDEAREMAREGVDIQLHTHRHWVPEDEILIRREILENRERIEAITGRPAEHFCYPSGVHYPELLGWLRKLNIRSATTCESRLAAATDDPLRLPRFLDHSCVSQTEFEAWAAGALRAFPRRSAYSPPARRPAPQPAENR